MEFDNFYLMLLKVLYLYILVIVSLPHNDWGDEPMKRLRTL